MAKRDIAGFLTGMPSNYAETMLESGRLAGDVMGGRLKGMLGGGKTVGLSPREEMQKGVRNFNKLDTQGKRDLIGRLQASGETSLAGQLASQLKADIKQEKADKSEEMLKNFATKTLEEKKNIINVLRSQGQTALAGQLASQMSVEVNQAQAQERIDIQRLQAEQQKKQLGAADKKYIRQVGDEADVAGSQVSTLLGLANDYSRTRPMGGVGGFGLTQSPNSAKLIS